VYDPPELVVFEINQDLLRGFVEEIRKIYQLRNVGIRVDIQLDSSVFVKAAEWWLQCVIGYAIKNSVDAVGDVPELQIVVAVRRAESNVEISVQDDGPGFPEHLLGKITERPVAREEGSRGLGIGLWVTSRIMQIVGGSAKAGNVQPHGALIVLTLPLVEKRT
jgi:C4-dicarboxylate-specific signal transduction histidine kinase